MRAREIRVMLNGKAESDVILFLTAIAESLSAQQQEITTIAEMMNNLTDILMQLGATVEGATNAVDELKKIRGN